ncbi:cellulase [Sarracenia purpurea var. burkii]
MVAEGLHKRPLEGIAASVASMGFNCVRLTWATYMYTRSNYSDLTVAESLDRWGLKDAKAGMAENNPGILGLSLWDAQKAVVDGLGAHGVAVVLDNHVSLPKWCCGDKDGNGFFGDEYFHPEEWLQGLTAVATRYQANPTVVAMSMRNELRGPRQNQNDWYKYMHMGAAAIHRANPNILVIVSGLSFETNLEFLKQKPLPVASKNKLVYEAHWYSFGDSPEKWLYQTNEFCGNVTRGFDDRSGFLVGGPVSAPLFLSEFGIDQRGGDEAENRYFGCLAAFVAERDIDWAFWTLQGSYMLREGMLEMEEVYGMFNKEWSQLRNSTMEKRLQLLQQATQEPRSSEPISEIMYHPQTGQCVQVGEDNNIHLHDCQRWSRWRHRSDGGPITLMDTPGSCLSAVGDGLPAVVSNDCSSPQSRWNRLSGSSLHIAAKDKRGRFLCLDWDSSSSSSSSSTPILTKKCLCLGEDSKDLPHCVENPQRQWFKLIPTNKT